MKPARAVTAGILTILIASAALPQTAGDPAFAHLRWRMIGPHRAGRTVGAVGIPDRPATFFIGVNNGGVWKTDDFGRTWKPIFDDQPTGSIGALAVAPSDPEILYVGSGEGLHRPDLSTGDGVFKSTDGGKSWRHMGLADVQQIGAVIVDPRDPDRVFVAALGHPYGANAGRGVFRSTDGGGSWQKVLYKDENTGAIALEFNPLHPDTVFAVLWSARQGPWENGAWEGKTSGLFRSPDGGSTWEQMTGGLPAGAQGLGRIGIAIARSDPSRMYAAVDAPGLGGIYRSDDAGAHWAVVNNDVRLWGRGNDFAELKVHPKERDVLFIGNIAAYKSIDGGRTVVSIKGAPGGDDYHGIWINPLHPDIMLFAADQGAAVTVNGGETWSSWYNQPTAQFYHVITDNQFPYHVYGGQQESGSVDIVSRGNDGRITFREWHPVGADEYASIAPDPLDPDIVYGGRVTRFDKRTGQTQNVAPEAIRSGKYRNLRTQPLIFSPADPKALYYATNVLFKTTDGGARWEVVSPDLSREAPELPANAGIFATPEPAKQPRRGVIYALAPSSLDANLIWAGTDDGLIHITRDGGGNWRDVTPPGITSWSKIAQLDAGHFDAGTAYAAVNRIKLDDLRPHIYRTHDGGATWTEIVAGLPESGPVNVVREDPVRRGMLYAGTERAVYVSFDDGARWRPLRLNMPATSIRDLVVHDADIVVGTHGRSFWILDDVSALRQMEAGAPGAGARLFLPDTAVRVRWNMYTDTPLPPEEPGGENPPDGAVIDYHLPRDAKQVDLAVSDAAGTIVRRYSSADPAERTDAENRPFPSYWIRPAMRLSAAKGMHRFIWDLHHAPPEGMPRSFPISAVHRNTASGPAGPWVLPGVYTVTLTVDGEHHSQPIVVRTDPRVKTPEAELRRQFDLSMTCYRGLGEIRTMIGENHRLREQVAALLPSVKDQAVKDTLASLEKKLKSLEGDGPPDDLDIVYSSVRDDAAARETFNGVQRRLLFIMLLLQAADAPPTASQEAAAREGEEIVRTIRGTWDSFRTAAVGGVNRLLGERRLDLLDAGTLR